MKIAADHAIAAQRKSPVSHFGKDQRRETDRTTGISIKPLDTLSFAHHLVTDTRSLTSDGIGQITRVIGAGLGREPIQFCVLLIIVEE